MELDVLRREVAKIEDRPGRELLSVLMDQLPEDRLDAALRILEALQSDTVKVTVVCPNETFEISFGSP